MGQYIYGKNIVMESIINKEEIECIFYCDELKDVQLKKTIQKYPCKKLTRKQMDDYFKTTKHQYIGAMIKDYPLYQFKDIVSDAKGSELYVLLDEIQDPHNFGAILRSCAAVGVDGIIIGKHRNAPLTPTVAKVSAGGILHTKVIQVNNLSQTVKKMKEMGYWIVGTTCENSQSLYQFDAKMPLVVIIGNEGKGVSDNLLKQCDFKLHIPIKNIESLNASVSCALMIYQIQYNRNNL